MKVKNIIKKVKVIRPLLALQVSLTVLPGSLGGQRPEKYLMFSLESASLRYSKESESGGSQKAEEYLRFSLKSESQKYNQESESDTAFACVAGPAECITGDSWRPEG